jgi:hypothetical protein
VISRKVNFWFSETIPQMSSGRSLLYLIRVNEGKVEVWKGLAQRSASVSERKPHLSRGKGKGHPITGHEGPTGGVEV